MLSCLFANNVTTEIIQLGINDQPAGLMGYVFASPGTDGITQEQRWVLYPGYAEPPRGKILLRQPANNRRRYTQLQDWKNAVLASDPDVLWINNSTYVKVNCMAYATVEGTHEMPPMPEVSPLSPPVDQARIPSTASAAALQSSPSLLTSQASISALQSRNPSAPLRPASPVKQVRAEYVPAARDEARPPTDWQVFLDVPFSVSVQFIELLDNGQRKGLVYATPKEPSQTLDEASKNYECWVLPPDYQPLGMANPSNLGVIVGGTEQEGTVEKFESSGLYHRGHLSATGLIFNKIASKWVTDSTLVLAHCAYLDGLRPADP